MEGGVNISCETMAYNVPRVSDAAAGGVPSRLMRRGRAPQRSEERKRLHAVICWFCPLSLIYFYSNLLCRRYYIIIECHQMCIFAFGQFNI